MKCAVSLTTSNRCKAVVRALACQPKRLASNPVAVEQVDRTVPLGPNALHSQQLVMYSCEGPFVQPNDCMGGDGWLFQDVVERPTGFSPRERLRAALRAPAEFCANTREEICQRSGIDLRGFAKVREKRRNVARSQCPVTNGVAVIAIVTKFEFHRAGHAILDALDFRLENHR